MGKSPLTPCPSRLGALIRDVNRFDPQVVFLSFGDAVRLGESLTSQGDWFVGAGKALQLCFNQVKEEAPTLKEIISKSVNEADDDPTSALKERILAYEYFRVARVNLQSVARMNALLRPILEERGRDEFSKSAIVSEWWSPSFWEPNDVARIRECQVCNQLFWAGRLDQTCCGPRCNHIRHSRQTREKYRQGHYQGVRLTEKERAEQRAAGKGKSLRIED